MSKATRPRPAPVAAPARSEGVARGVVDALMRRVLSGTYAAGARLPSERDLASTLEVARVSVREALGVLVSWGVVQTTRGSGATVLPRHAWTSDALAAALAYELEAGHFDAVAAMVTDALELRRALVLDLLSRAAGRVAPGGLRSARAALEVAAAAGDRRAFLEADRRIIPLVLEAAGMLPSLWVLNSMAAPYLATMGRFSEGASIDPRYRDAHLALFDALEAGDRDRARDGFARHLDEADRRIVLSLPEPLKQLLRRTKRRT